MSEVCEEMDISQNLVSRWQDLALEGMLQNLDPYQSREKAPALSKRLEKIQTTNEKKQV